MTFIILGFGMMGLAAQALESSGYGVDDSPELKYYLLCQDWPKGETAVNFSKVNKRCNASKSDEDKLACYKLATDCIAAKDKSSLAEKLKAKECDKKSVHEANICFFDVLTALQSGSSGGASAPATQANQ